MSHLAALAGDAAVVVAGRLVTAHDALFIFVQVTRDVPCGEGAQRLQPCGASARGREGAPRPAGSGCGGRRIPQPGTAPGVSGTQALCQQAGAPGGGGGTCSLSQTPGATVLLHAVGPGRRAQGWAAHGQGRTQVGQGVTENRGQGQVPSSGRARPRAQSGGNADVSSGPLRSRQPKHIALSKRAGAAHGARARDTERDAPRAPCSGRWGNKRAEGAAQAAPGAAGSAGRSQGLAWKMPDAATQELDSENTRRRWAQSPPKLPMPPHTVPSHTSPSMFHTPVVLPPPRP